MMAPPRRCQSIKCPYPRAGTGVRVRRSLERGEARSRGLRTLERGGARSREACTLERGGACSRGPLTGPPRWAAGATAAWASSRARALSEMRLALVFFAGFKWDFPSCFRGPSGLSPTTTPVKIQEDDDADLVLPQRNLEAIWSPLQGI
jgi:hypothetical protein